MEDNRINIFSKNYVINTLKKIGANPLKRLGQNFLIDKNVINNIKSLIPNSYTLIEIGPGLGHMRLVYPENNHIGIEIDKKLAAFLQSEGFNVINDDFLNIDLKNIIKDKTLIFGNLPYYITTEIILHIIRNISKYNCAKRNE